MNDRISGECLLPYFGLIVPSAKDTELSLLHIRKNFGLSRAQLAASLGVGKDTLRRWETGERNPRVRINSTEYFLNEKATQLLHGVTDLLQSFPEINTTVSYHTVYSILNASIEGELRLKKNGQPAKGFKQCLTEILENIEQKRKRYEFTYLIIGLELIDVDLFQCGEVEIFRFSENIVSRFSTPVLDGKFFTERVEPFIRVNLLDKVCIRCSAFGDEDTAEAHAIGKIIGVINALRFIFCLLAPERVHRNLLKINLESESFGEHEKFIRLDEANGVTLSMGIGRQNLEPFPINQERIAELKDKLSWNDLLLCVNNDNKTELEGVIATALHWAGEAQNEFDRAVAFVKYWTSIECIFSVSKEEVTHVLAMSVSILCTFQPARLVAVEKTNEVYKDVERLYDLRSRIVHRGLRDRIQIEDFQLMCKYASWCVLGLIHLRSMGYTKISEVIAQIKRLYTVMNRGAAASAAPTQQPSDTHL